MAQIRASDLAYQRVRDEIVDWTLPPGSILGEVEQSTRLGVSRTPLREALTRLIAEGLVASQSGRGLVVTELSLTNIRELFEVRQALEQQAARLAAIRGDTAVFAALAEELRAVPALLSSDDPARHAYYELVGRMDEAIDLATDNAYLIAALKTLRTHLVRVRRLAKDRPDRLSAAASEHLLIAEAIADRDPELAASATQVHLHRALASLLENAAPLSSSAKEQS